MLLGLVRRKGVARIVYQGGVSGFELTLAPSREGSKRYAVESIREIDRHTALKILMTCDLASALLLVLPEDFPAQEQQDKNDGREASTAARIAFVKLTSGQVLSMFEVIRSRDADVRELYADLEGKNFGMTGDRVRGAVIRAYAASGAARGEGIVMELPHKRADGKEAVFNISIKDHTTDDSGVEPGEVKADYFIRLGKRVEAYAVTDGRVSLLQSMR